MKVTATTESKKARSKKHSWSDICLKPGVYIPDDDKSVYLVSFGFDINSYPTVIYVSDPIVEPATVSAWEDRIFTKVNDNIIISIKG